MQLLEDSKTAMIGDSAVAERVRQMNPLLYDKSILKSSSQYSVEHAISNLT